MYDNNSSVGFMDSGRRPFGNLRWVCWNNVLVCTHTILTHISWVSLKRKGFLFDLKQDSLKAGTASVQPAVALDPKETAMNARHILAVSDILSPEEIAKRFDVPLEFVKTTLAEAAQAKS